MRAAPLKSAEEMQVFRYRTLHAVGIAFLILTCFLATPRGAVAQDAASFIGNLGAQGLRALDPMSAE